MLCPLKSCENGCHCVKSYGISILVLLLILAIWLLKLNQPLFFAINGMHSIVPVFVWQAICYIAAPKKFILAIILLIATFLFQREKLKNVIIMYILFYIGFYVLKILIHEARPYAVLAANSMYWLSGPEDSIKNMYKSFPSGHTGNAAIFVFTCMRLFFAKSCTAKARSYTAKTLLILFLVIVGIERIATGWHWPLDILISGMIGYIIVQICLCNKDAYCK